MQTYNFAERPATAFAIRPLRSTDRSCLSTEATFVQENMSAWSKVDSGSSLIRNQVFLKDLIVTRPNEILVLRVVSKFSNKTRYLQLISITFPRCEGQKPTYKLSFVSEIQVVKDMTNFALYGVTEKIVFVLADNTQKAELCILGLPLRSPTLTRFCSAKKGNVKTTINIARAFTGIVKKFTLLDEKKEVD